MKRKTESGLKKRRRLCSLTLAGLLAVSALCGCGKDEDYSKLLDKDSPVTVNIWHYYNGVQQTQFDEIVDEFNNTVGSEMGIVVEANSKNSVNELAESVLASVNKEPGADTPPNIFGTYVETAYQIDKMGQIADLSKYFTEEEIGEYVDEYIQEGAFGGEGTLKVFPTAKSTEVMMINATDWQKFADAEGVSYEDLSTWEGLIEVAEKYYEYTDALTPDVPNDGKAFFGRDSLANYLVVGAKQLGHAFAVEGEDGSVQVSSDKETVKRLWENFYVPYVKGYYFSESRFRSDDAKIGSIIALVCSTTGATYYPTEVTINDEYTYPIENVVLPVPNFEGCDPYVVQQGAGMSVLKSDERTEYACAVFLKWFTDKQQNIRFAVNSGYLPVKKEANDSEVIFADSSAQEMGATMQNIFQVAIDEVHDYSLYTSPPYDSSAQVRSYIEDIMETTSKDAYMQAKERIAAGEDREAVWKEYTDDEAFEKWYETFEQGLDQAVGNE